MHQAPLSLRLRIRSQRVFIACIYCRSEDRKGRRDIDGNASTYLNTVLIKRAVFKSSGPQPLIHTERMRAARAAARARASCLVLRASSKLVPLRARASRFGLVQFVKHIISTINPSPSLLSTAKSLGIKPWPAARVLYCLSFFSVDKPSGSGIYCLHIIVSIKPCVSSRVKGLCFLNCLSWCSRKRG